MISVQRKKVLTPGNTVILIAFDFEPMSTFDVNRQTVKPVMKTDETVGQNPIV